MEYHFGFPVDTQRWILGKALATEDSLTLSEFGVTQGCAIFLYLINEPPSPAPPRRSLKSKSQGPELVEKPERIDIRKPEDNIVLENRIHGAGANAGSQNGARPKEPRFKLNTLGHERKVSPLPDRLKADVPSDEKNGNWKADRTTTREVVEHSTKEKYDHTLDERIEDDSEEENVDSEEEDFEEEEDILIAHLADEDQKQPTQEGMVKIHDCLCARDRLNAFSTKAIRRGPVYSCHKPNDILR